MEISDYIISILEKAGVGVIFFDIGSDDWINIEEKSLNRIKFEVIKK